LGCCSDALKRTAVRRQGSRSPRKAAQGYAYEEVDVRDFEL
jgi:hypothetical protein